MIYYWYLAESLIYMLIAYSKDQQDDLSATQKRALSKLVRQELK